LGLCTYCGESHGTVCPIKPAKPKPLDDKSSLNSNSSSSKLTNNTSNSSKPKGCVAQVIDSVAEESDLSEDAANMDF